MLSRLNDWPIGRKMLVAFLLLSACAAAVGSLALVKIEEIERMSQATKQSLTVVEYAEELTVSIDEQQSGIRGFLLSGDPAFLSLYRDAVERFARSSGGLRTVVIDDPENSERLRVITSDEVRYRSDIAEPQIELMRHPNTVEQARAIEAAGLGKDLVDDIRAATKAIVAAEHDKVARRSKVEAVVMRSAYIAVGTGIALALGLSGILALLTMRLIARPISGMTAVMRRLADGDHGLTVPDLGRKDEVGVMAQAVEVFRRNMQAAETLRAEQEAERGAKERRNAAVLRLVTEFEQSVERSLSLVTRSATELNGTATDMASVAQQTRHQASASSAAAEETSANVQTVATATEEMAATLREISERVAQSSAMTASAVEQANRSDAEVRAMDEAAARIGEVVALISQIAAQTNLLALNATIEAARAGEAGKGFAVVAGEVKSLATQTARATGEIAGQVEAMQRAAIAVGGTIRNIARTIVSIDESSSAIAAAVEEQTAATQEIARNVNGAARSTELVSQNVADVDHAAARTGEAAQEVLGAAGQLSGEADQLRREVDRFLGGIRAA